MADAPNAIGTWTPWYGGKCPVPVDSLVDFKDQNGVEYGPALAVNVDWERKTGNVYSPKVYRLHVAKAPAVAPAPLPVTMEPDSALDVQVGGEHYRDMAIQPIEYIHANGLQFAEGCVVKYVSRWRAKNGIADLEKARHFLDLLIELERKRKGGAS